LEESLDKKAHLVILLEGKKKGVACFSKFSLDKWVPKKMLVFLRLSLDKKKN
jgi:hypothetical protein